MPYDVALDPCSSRGTRRSSTPPTRVSIRVLVAFNGPAASTRLPSVRAYTRAMRAFRARFPWVRDLGDVERGQPRLAADGAPPAPRRRSTTTPCGRVPQLPDRRRRRPRPGRLPRGSGRSGGPPAARGSGACTTTSTSTATATSRSSPPSRARAARCELDRGAARAARGARRADTARAGASWRPRDRPIRRPLERRCHAIRRPGRGEASRPGPGRCCGRCERPATTPRRSGTAGSRPATLPFHVADPPLPRPVAAARSWPRSGSARRRPARARRPRGPLPRPSGTPSGSSGAAPPSAWRSCSSAGSTTRGGDGVRR